MQPLSPANCHLEVSVFPPPTVNRGRIVGRFDRFPASTGVQGEIGSGLPVAPRWLRSGMPPGTVLERSQWRIRFSDPSGPQLLPLKLCWLRKRTQSGSVSPKSELRGSPFRRLASPGFIARIPDSIVKDKRESLFKQHYGAQEAATAPRRRSALHSLRTRTGIRKPYQAFLLRSRR
jgi:hypothetical protein